MAEHEHRQKNILTDVLNIAETLKDYCTMQGFISIRELRKSKWSFVLKMQHPVNCQHNQYQQSVYQRQVNEK